MRMDLGICGKGFLTGVQYGRSRLTGKSKLNSIHLTVLKLNNYYRCVKIKHPSVLLSGRRS